jgi:hypothetical protein
MLARQKLRWLNTSRLELVQVPLRQPWDDKLYGSWPQLMHAEIVKRPAVSTTLSYNSYR